jgi:polyisoprenoid-binding protein YceI
MKRSRIVTMAAALALAWMASAAAAGVALRTGGTLWLDGKSTVHEFKSTTTQLEARFDEIEARWPSGAKGAAALEAFVRAKGVTSMQLLVPVRGLHSGKSGLDKNMYKALQASEHPAIRFVMSGYEVEDGKTPGTLAIDAKGTLEIAGVERSIHLPIVASRAGDAIRLQGSVPVLMTDYGIKPPTMMMGALKTADQVVVSFDLALESKDASVSKPQ